MGEDRSGSRTWLKYVEGALWAFGLGCLCWSLWTWGDALWYQHSSARLLEEGAVYDPPSTSSGERVLPAPGTALARLSIPRLELAAVVAEGTREEVLRRAVGRLTGGALPGEEGNLVLAGHRDTFFRPLRKIEVGDRVLVERGSQTDVYVVEWTRVVTPREIEVATSTGYAAVTLITCHPFDYIGSAPDRFVVRARRMERSG